MELTLNKFLKILFEKLWLIILITIIFGISAFSISSFLMKPKYESSTTFKIFQSTETGTNNIAYIQDIKPDYIIYSKSDVFLDAISENLNANTEFVNEYAKISNRALDSVQLSELIEVTDYDKNSTYFNVTVQTLSSRTAFLICNEISTKAPAIYKQDKSFQSDQVSSDNLPKENLIPVSPNIPLNTVIGILLGLIVSVLLILIIETIDNSVKDEYDLIDNYEIPLLGIVYKHEVIEKETGA